MCKSDNQILRDCFHRDDQKRQEMVRTSSLAESWMLKWPSTHLVYICFRICTFRLPLISETAWWNWWRSSCLRNHPMCDVSSLMMPSSQVDLKGIFFSPFKNKMKLLMLGTKSNFNAIISNMYVQKAWSPQKERNLKIQSPCLQLNSELCCELQQH